MDAILYALLTAFFIVPLAMPGRRSLLVCVGVGAMLFGSMWLEHLHEQSARGSRPLDSESAIVQLLYFWALGLFCCGIAAKLALMAWFSRR